MSNYYEYYSDDELDEIYDEYDELDENIDVQEQYNEMIEYTDYDYTYEKKIITCIYIKYKYNLPDLKQYWESSK